jgi:hypothetical protein
VRREEEQEERKEVPHGQRQNSTLVEGEGEGQLGDTEGRAKRGEGEKEGRGKIAKKITVLDLSS